MAKSSARRRSLTPPQVVSMLVIFLALSCVGGVPSAGFAASFVGATAALTKAPVELFEEFPNDLSVQPPSQIPTLLASDGSEIIKFYAENRIVVSLSSIPINTQSTIVAAEDQRFYQYQGVDSTDMVRALVSNNAGGSCRGTSTLTQQYVRNTLIETGLKGDDHKFIRDATKSTVVRKLRETKFALSLEQKYPKRQILEDYLNIAAFSPFTYGVEAFSLHYFGKHAKDLAAAKVALPVGAINAPSAYDPKSQPELTKNCRDWVLTKMLEEKFTARQQYDEAVGSEVKLDIQDPPAGCGAADSYAYFCIYVISEVLGSENLGPSIAARHQLLMRDGLKIITTLNLERQSAADSVIQARTPIGGSDRTSSATISIEFGTGRIQALAQNTNCESSQLVLAADVKHDGIELPDGNVGPQSGPTFKAIILAEWLKTGHTPYQILSTPAPKNYGSNTFTVPCSPDHAAGSWPISNVAGTDTGIMTVREATKQSINMGFAEMLRDFDIYEVTKLVASMSITKAGGSQLNPDPSIALGNTPVPPLSMASAHTTFVSGGKYCKSIAINQTLGVNGTSMAVPSADCAQVMDQGAADETAKTLRATPESGGTAKDVVFGRSVAGKTGTTDEAENTWFVGFIPRLSTVVWIGDATESGKSLAGRMIGGVYFPGIYSSDLAVPIWRDYMPQAVANNPVLSISSHG